MMADKRMSKGADRNRILLYVPDDKRAVLNELLLLIPENEASSLSSAIFTALEGWVSSAKRTQEPKSILGPVVQIASRFTSEVTDAKQRASVFRYIIRTFLVTLQMALLDIDYAQLLREFDDPAIGQAIVLLKNEYEVQLEDLREALPAAASKRIAELLSEFRVALSRIGKGSEGEALEQEKSKTPP